MPTPFHESPPGATPIRDLNLTIAGSPLEPILAEFGHELEAAGIRRVRPRFYLSTEWGVPEGTVAIAIPFYLARPDLTALHAERAGYIEGSGRARRPPLPPARDGPRRQLRLRAVRPARVGRGVRPDHGPLPRGLSARAVQPSVRPPPAGLVRPEAPRRGLGRDVRRLDDSRARLAVRIRRLARRPGEAPPLRPPDGRSRRPRPDRHLRGTRRGRLRAGPQPRRTLPRLRCRSRCRSPRGSTGCSGRSSRTSATPNRPRPTCRGDRRRA